MKKVLTAIALVGVAVVTAIGVVLAINAPYIAFRYASRMGNE